MRIPRKTGIKNFSIMANVVVQRMSRWEKYFELVAKQY